MDKRIGAQYYTIREHLKTMEDFDLSCQKIAGIGYKLVQVSGTPLPAKEMREVLDKYGLSVVTTHRRFDDFLAHLDEVIDYNKTLGTTLCGMGMIPHDRIKTSAAWSQFITEINWISEELGKENMHFGHHNHELEYAKLDGKLIMDRLIEETDPEQFKFIFDTYWAQVGGVSPQDEIRRLGRRAMAVHFKDYKIDQFERSRVQMCEVGSGNLNWNEIISACEESGVRWVLVEQDVNHVDGDPFKALKMSYDYLMTKGFI